MIRILSLLLLVLALAACDSRPESDDQHGHGDEAGHAHDEESGGEEAHAHGDEDDHARGDEAADVADEHRRGDEEGSDEHGHGHGEAEGGDRTTIAADIAQDSGIRVQPAGPGEIADEHEVQGLLTPVEGRVASVMARFPGPIRNVRVNVGDVVKSGQALATIESNLSLTTYTVSAPIAGTVLARTASLGGVASEGAALFEIADLSSLWVDLHVFGSDAGHITAGVPVRITRLSDGKTAQSTLERILPGTATASQSTVARAAIANEDGLWRPGSAVRALITVQRKPAAIVVPLAALQTFENVDAVFVREGDEYVARKVALGMRDAERVEVLSGLVAGEEVVVEQSYVVKADIEKSGASHDH